MPEINETNVTPTPNAISLDSKLTVNGKEVSVQSLVDAANRTAELEHEAKALRELKAASATLLNQSADDAARRDAVVAIMKQNGWSEERINAQLRTLEEQEEGEVPPQPKGGKGQGGKAPAKGAVESEVEQIRSEIASLRKEEAGRSVDETVSLIQQSTVEALDENADVAKLMKAAKGSRDEATFARLAGIVESDLSQRVGRTVMQRMRDAKAKKAPKEWVTEAVRQAIPETVEFMRTVIGDPSRIGRSAETGSAEFDQFDEKPPVPTPKYRAGADNRSAIKNWMSDQLSRSAAEMVRSGSDD